MKIYNPNREERAFLYQEAQDLESLLKNLGSLSVMVEEVAPKRVPTTRPNNYRVTFMVAPETFGMKVQATDSNLFDATIAAKEETVRQLNAIVNSLPQEFNPTADDVKPDAEGLH